MLEINKTYNECSLLTMQKMSEEMVDLVVTSPPYDNLRNYNGYTFDFEAIVKRLYTIIKMGGVLVWVIGDSSIGGSESGTSFKQALHMKEVGFRLHDTMIFLKQNQRPRQYRANRYEQIFDYMFVFSKGTKPKKFHPIQEKCKHSGKTISFRSRDAVKENGFTAGDNLANKKTVTIKSTKNKGNVWQYNTGSNTASDPVAFRHPAIFPEQLVADHVLSWTDEGDLVYDPFMGSGTTAVVSVVLRRNYIGSEVSSVYCDNIDERLHNLDEKKSIALRNKLLRDEE